MRDQILNLTLSTSFIYSYMQTPLYSFFHSDSLAQPSSFYGPTTIDIFFDNFGCTGSELSLLDCPSMVPGSTCTHQSEAGVRCNPARKIYICKYGACVYIIIIIIYTYLATY